MVIAIQVALVAIRTIHLSVTGFMSSDEATYVLYSMAGRTFSHRFLFDYSLLFMFGVLGIDSVSKFVLLLPFYASFWGVSFILACYRITGLLTDNLATRNLTILSLLFIWSYALLSVGFLSETPALTLCAVGVYFWLSYAKGRGRQFLMIALLAFVAAAYMREPFLIFPIASALALPLELFRRRLRYLLYLILIPLVAAASLSYEPFPSLVPGWWNSLFTGLGSAGSTNDLIASIAGVANLAAAVATEFMLGLFLGWNPVLFFVGAAGLLIVLRMTIRRKISVSILFVATLSLLAFLGVIVLLSGFTDFFLGEGASTLIRFSSPTVIAYLLFSPFFFERLSGRQRKIFTVVLVGFTVASFGVYSQVTQSNLRLPYNALSFDQKYGPLLAREYFTSNMHQKDSTTVFIAWDWKVGQVYLYGLPGVHFYPSIFQPYISEDVFLQLRPTEFYVLSAGPLQTTVNGSIFTLGLVAPPNFISEIYSKVHNQTYVSVDNPYAITSVKLLFNVPTGHLLKVNVQWSEDQTPAGSG